MDELLNQLAAEYIAKKEAKIKSSTPPPSRRRSPQDSESTAPMDKLLADIQAEFSTDQVSNTTNTPAKVKPNVRGQIHLTQGDRHKLIAEIEGEYQRQVSLREEKRAALKRQQEALLAEQKRREQELIAARKLEEQREQKRKAALQQKAQQWLKTLNPNSEEGRWFEEFSYSYDSKLAAAIDYLEAMRETGF